MNRAAPPTPPDLPDETTPRRPALRRIPLLPLPTPPDAHPDDVAAATVPLAIGGEIASGPAVVSAPEIHLEDPLPDAMRPARSRRWPFVVGLGLVLVAAMIFHYDFFLPQLDKPTKFFLVDSVFEFAVAALIALSAATLGARVLRMFPRGSLSRLERGLAAYGLGTGGLALGTALIGLLHGYYFPVLCAVVVAPLLVLRDDLRRVVGALNPLRPSFVLGELQPRSTFESAMFAVSFAVLALIAEHALVPFWGFDVFMYHFALPERFLALHELFGSPGIPQANLPYNNEMLNLLALNFRAEIGAGMLQAFFVGATCLAVFALGVRLLSRRVAWLGMAIFLVTPLVLYYTSSGLIDQQFAFMALLIILAVLEYRAQRQPAWMILAGILLGIGLGVKYQVIYLVAPLLIYLIWWSRPQATETAAHLGALWRRTIITNFTLLGFCALDAFALWGLREWVQVGNPVFPLLWGGAEWTPQRLVFYKSQFDNFGSLHHSFLSRIVAIFDWFLHWQKYDYTGLPPLPVYALAALAPLLLWRARTEAAKRVRESVVFLLWLSFVSLLLWGLVDQLVPRYVLPTFGLLALLAAVVLDRAVRWLATRCTPRGRDVAFACAGVLALLPGIVFAVQTRQQADPSPVYTGQQSYAAYIQATQLWPSYWRTVDFFNTEVPLTTPVLGVNLAAGYFFDDPYLTPDMNRDIIFYLHQIAPTDAEKMTWLRLHGYTYVIYDRTVSLWSQARDPDNLLTPLVPSFEAFLGRNLILVNSFDGTDVYLVPSATVAGTGGA